jgi:leucyl/phenylalanyl-tRNA--protein transferase
VARKEIALRLTPEVMVYAYSQGVFPMGEAGEIRWFSPDPRGIIPLDRFHVSKTLRAVIRQGRFEIRLNTAFAEVMRACAKRGEGTWITRKIVDAYVELHKLGLAHSVEAWNDGTLAGGLYGVALGGAFFGESMFHTVRDASKVALVALVERMRDRGFKLLDTQYITPHLERFGAIEITQKQYLAKLARALQHDCKFAGEVQTPSTPRKKNAP